MAATRIYDDKIALSTLGPASKYVPVVKADSDLPDGITSFLIVGTAGTLNLMQADGTIQANVPLPVGRNDLRVRQVRLGGTGADVIACYA